MIRINLLLGFIKYIYFNLLEFIVNFTHTHSFRRISLPVCCNETFHSLIFYFLDVKSLILLRNHLDYFHDVLSILIRSLPRHYFPCQYSKGVNITLFRVMVFFNDFGSHPVNCAKLLLFIQNLWLSNGKSKVIQLQLHIRWIIDVSFVSQNTF